MSCLVTEMSLITLYVLASMSEVDRRTRSLGFSIHDMELAQTIFDKGQVSMCFFHVLQRFVRQSGVS